MSYVIPSMVYARRGMPHLVPIPGSARARLIEAAISQFQEHGYEQANVTRIASMAGVTTGALYHHFESKQGLFGVIREEMERRMTERMEGASAAVGGGRAGVKAAFEVSVDAAARFGVTRILAEPGPSDHDPIVDTLETMLSDNRVLARCLASMWRGALASVADGAEPSSARGAIKWILGVEPGAE